MRHYFVISAVVAGVLAASLQAAATTVSATATDRTPADTDTLYENFKTPPRSFGPRVWWHWMHGNVTKDGIRKDLEWMDRAGIVGFHQFNAQLAPTDVIVKERVKLFSPEWEEMFRYALDVADSLGMEVSIASSPGWSITGGPWVTMENAQKKITWQTLEVRGGRRIREKLPEPYEFSGPFQDRPQWPKDIYKYRFYRDIAVLAVCTDGMTPADTVAAWYNKAGFEINSEVTSHNPATTARNAARKVVDVTAKVKDGVLDWKAPAGNWTVYRFGYNLLGKHNGPVEAAGVGLESDKLSRSAMEKYYSDYLAIMDKASGHRLGKTVKYLMIDSYEAGKGTWTPDLPEQFKARRGYDLIPWLPVLAGVVVGSAEQSDDFLFDWRRTLGELLAENHYDLAGEVLARYGMKYHAESHEQASAFIGDGMMPKRGAAIPMGAIWVNFGTGWYSSSYAAEADLHESASVAHIYGGNICAAESFSVNSRPTVKGHFPAYQCHPANLKRIADAALSLGLNRFIMHCSPHQPVDDRIPGLGLGSFGNWFNRHDTWAEEARPWHDYLARSCYLLQQGRNVADIAYFYGEDRNATARFRYSKVPVPEGYAFDFVNADVLMNVLEARDGRLTSPGGASYRLLVIDSEVDAMTPEMSRRIAAIEKAGVKVCDARGKDVKAACLAALAEAGIAPDFTVDTEGSNAASAGFDVRFVHRTMPGKEIYWVGNISPEAGSFAFGFNARAKSVSVWNADRGGRKQVPFEVRDGRTLVSLDMETDDAVFVVIDLMNEGGKPSEPLPVRKTSAVAGPWNLSFQAGRGAPDGVTMETLAPLDESPVEGIRYFSGTVRYATDFSLSMKDGEKVEIDLGKVYFIAHVYVNGQDMGLVWHSPYRCDISAAVKDGLNRLELDVTNVWANRMIGDSSKPRAERITYTPWQFYNPGSPLPKSGLAGPVVIIQK